MVWMLSLMVACAFCPGGDLEALLAPSIRAGDVALSKTTVYWSSLDFKDPTLAGDLEYGYFVKDGDVRLRASVNDLKEGVTPFPTSLDDSVKAVLGGAEQFSYRVSDDERGAAYLRLEHASRLWLGSLASEPDAAVFAGPINVGLVFLERPVSEWASEYRLVEGGSEVDPGMHKAVPKNGKGPSLLFELGKSGEILMIQAVQASGPIVTSRSLDFEEVDGVLLPTRAVIEYATTPNARIECAFAYVDHHDFSTYTGVLSLPVEAQNVGGALELKDGVTGSLISIGDVDVLSRFSEKKARIARPGASPQRAGNLGPKQVASDGDNLRMGLAVAGFSAFALAVAAFVVQKIMGRR